MIYRKKRTSSELRFHRTPFPFKVQNVRALTVRPIVYAQDRSCLSVRLSSCHSELNSAHALCRRSHVHLFTCVAAVEQLFRRLPYRKREMTRLFRVQVSCAACPILLDSWLI